MTLREYLENYDQILNEKTFIVPRTNQTPHANQIKKAVDDAEDFIKYLEYYNTTKEFSLGDLAKANSILKALKAIRIYDDCNDDQIKDLMKRIKIKIRGAKSGLVRVLKKELFSENSKFNSINSIPELKKMNDITREVLEQEAPNLSHRISEMITNKIRELKGQKPLVKDLWKYIK